MKKSILIVVSILFCFQTYSQRQINEQINVENQTRISVETEYAHVTIKTWDNDYVLLSGTIDINDNQSNDAFEYKINSSSNTIRISSEMNLDKADKIKIPENQNGKSCIMNSSNGRGVLTDLKLIITIPKKLEINTKGLYGGVKIIEPYSATIVNNTYASVDVICDADKLPPLDLTSTYAVVDVTLPANAEANLSMDTGYGKMFTDFEYTISGKGNKEPMFGGNLETKLNGGGPKVTLHSGYANIYVRKK